MGRARVRTFCPFSPRRMETSALLESAHWRPSVTNLPCRGLKKHSLRKTGELRMPPCVESAGSETRKRCPTYRGSPLVTGCQRFGTKQLGRWLLSGQQEADWKEHGSSSPRKELASPSKSIMRFLAKHLPAAANTGRGMEPLSSYGLASKAPMRKEACRCNSPAAS